MPPHPAPSGPMAAIDIGTNSIRLLIASVGGPDVALSTLRDESATVRLGTGVEETGRLDPGRMEHAVDTIVGFHQLARRYHASPILIAATSAVRDAGNGDELRRRITGATGLEPRIISGEEEARLTYAGATMGEPRAGAVLVADLGGGSLELIVARDGIVERLESLRLGSGRLTERHVNTDPPVRDALATIARDASAVLTPLAPTLGTIDRCILVGGTAQSLPVVTRQGDARTLTRAGLAATLEVLLATPVATVAGRSGLDEPRVRTLAAGAAIIDTLLAVCGLDGGMVRHGGLRQGLILDSLSRR